jgi:glycosyltransferase involved in cell wall biosynthesis
MANQTMQLQRLLVREGVHVKVVNTQAPYRPRWVARFRGVRALFRLVPYLFSVWRSCRDVAVVHVMANSGWSWHLFAAPAVNIARWRGKRVIVNYRGGLAREFLRGSAGSVRRTLESATLIVPSRFLHQVFGEFGVSAMIIPNVVDLERFRPRSAPALPGRHVVVARNLEQIYGIDLALRAAALLRKTMPDIRFSIAGGGADGIALEALANELGVASIVTFTGRLQPDAIADLLRTADVVLNPVRADNTPNSVLESLACGVPVVSTNVGGVPFLVEHGKTAWLVSPESPEALAEGVRTVLGDAELRRRLVTEGMQLAHSCSWSVVREQWLSTYRASDQRG